MKQAKLGIGVITAGLIAATSVFAQSVGPGISPLQRSRLLTSSGTWVVNSDVSIVYVDGCAGGGSGGGGQASANTSGGGGGGGGVCISQYPLHVTPGNTITVTLGSSAAGVAAASAGNVGASATLSGFDSGSGSDTINISPGAGGLAGAAGVGGTGGAGGGLGFGSAGGAANTNATNVSSGGVGPAMAAGGGGGGGASTAGSAGLGAQINPGIYVRSSGGGSDGGGGGGNSYFGLGANGSANGVACSATPGYGAGGGGGGTNAASCGGGTAFFRLTYFSANP